MTSFLTYNCNGDCAAAENEDPLSSNEVTSLQIAGPGLIKTIHLCNAECNAKFMDGRLSGGDIFLSDDEDEDASVPAVAG